MSAAADSTAARAERSAANSKRSAQACERCRRRKVRCSGTYPCTHCRRRDVPCHFIEGSQRISVSERYLRQLQSQARASTAAGHGSPPTSSSHTESQNRPLSPQLPSPPSPPSTADATTVPEGDDFARNPLVRDRPFLRDPVSAQQQQWFLGPSSTWSFSRCVVNHLDQALPAAHRPSLPANLDGAAYSLDVLPPPPHEAHNASGGLHSLPSLDHAIYLFNTVKFHLNQLFHFVDEELFAQELQAFYRSGATVEAASPLWCAQYLFIMAFGKAFLSSPVPRSSSVVPKGWTFASQAFALLPMFHSPDQDNILAIEVFGLAAVYLQSVDMRVTAFEFAGRALRMCYVVGIHRGCLPDGIGQDLTIRCARLWWSVYMLDQHVSALMGAPSSIDDSDITVPLPSSIAQSRRDAALGVHVKLSRLLSRLVRTVYSVQSSVDGSFLSEAQEMLRGLAQVSRDMDQTAQTWSLLSSQLHLYYHYCIVVTTRPIVMCIVARCTDSLATFGRLTSPSLSEPVSALLQACVDSAFAILRMLRNLKDEDLLQSFLPFHLEQAFSSAFVLRVVSATTPEKVDHHMLQTLITEILDGMIAGGNNLARLRQMELDHLGALLTRLDMGDVSPESKHAHADFSHRSLPSYPVDHPSGAYDIGMDFDVNRACDLTELAGILDIDDMSGHIMFDNT